MNNDPHNHTYDNFFKVKSPDFNPEGIKENKIKPAGKFHFLQFIPVALIIAAILYFVFR
ncbi:hypothetical protein [Clostridium sp. JN-9]|uniref:hypothetical protein n=1 Tax=Clostridium sp. JN-9 TaxID=2507159 RepID=UPI0013E8BD19|nr:hypothetical protein [Clostridium sp. JN-9]